jgi:membrane protease YdiL (CAAX protease family)
LEGRQLRFSVALVYLALIALAEVVHTFVDLRLGLVLHGALLLMLLLHAALASEHPYHRLLLALALAPLIRMSSLAVPLLRFPQLYWYLIISVPLFIGAGLSARVLGLSREQLGLTIRKVPLQLLVALTGITFGILEYNILKLDPLIEDPTWESMMVGSAILVICTGLAEELIFRGVIQRVSVQALGRFGLVFTALLFAALHIGWGSPFDVVLVFGVALLFGWVTESSWSLLGVTLAHGITNIVLFLVMPFWGQ